MLRFSIIIIAFLLSLLCVLKAPVYFLWFAAIMVEEFPWIFIGLEIALLLWGIKVKSWQVTGNVFAGISLILFLSPVVRAYLTASSLRTELANSFTNGKDIPQGKPFSAIKMISGIGARKITYKTILYTKPDDLPLTLDYYSSAGDGLRPCVVVVHGGSWAAGDSQQVPELNSLLAEQGYNVASINYRLAPLYKSPAPVEDTRAAIEYLKKNSVALRIDTTRFVLLGRSAGGQIALTAAYTLNDPGIKGVIGFYAPADMVWGYAQPTMPLIMDSRKVMEDYLGGTYVAVPEQYHASSAVSFVTPATVPTLLIHGKNDVLVFYEHSIRLSKKLQENNVPHYLLTWDWGTHGGDYTLNGPSGQLSTYSVEYFLKTVTSR